MARIKYVVLLVLKVFISTIDSAVVTTKLGSIEGVTTKLNTGKTVDAFLGIPYSIPPTGDRRFAPPQPVKPWDGTLQAKQKPGSCIQAASEDEKQTVWCISNKTESEDCLYLSIWRPSVMPEKKMEVMVWIHGGGFAAGSSGISIYDGDIMATEENIIVVTLNYRLTIFGLLYLDIPEAPGNVNLQDQILAIQWVHDNIESFGGDPNKITLAGESVGGVSVGYHLINPAMQKLFRNGILESSTPNLGAVVNQPDKALSVSLQEAKKLGCPCNEGEDKKKVLNCLLQKSSAELIAPYRHFKLLPYFAQVANGIEVCKNPETCAATVPKKPILLGNMKNEANFFLKFIVPNISIDDNTVITEKMWKQAITYLLSLTDDRLIEIAMKPYQGVDQPYNPNQVRLEIGSFMSDAIFICTSKAFAEQYASTTANTFMYFFNQRLAKPRTPMPLWAGAVHGDAIPYTMGNPLNSDLGYPTDEIPFSRQIMGYWAQFVKTNDPNRNGSPAWPTFDTKSKTYLSLAVNNTFPIMDVKKKNCDFWSNTIPQLLSLQADLNKLNNNTSVATK